MAKSLPEPASTPSPLRSWHSLLLIVALVWGATQAISWWQARELGQQIRQLAKPGVIVMYTSNTCVYCLKAEAWLASYDISWQPCNIDTNAVCQSQFQRQGAPGTPLFKVANQWRLGLDPEWLARALASQG